MAEIVIIQKRNIVILGRIGTGKKSIANQILNKPRFHIHSSMESVTRAPGTEEAEETDEQRKVHYKIKIIDTLGPYSAMIDKQTIFNHIIDYSRDKVSEGVNLILFTLRKDVYNITEEIDVLRTILKDFKDEIRGMCALIVTGCEGLNEEGKESVIQEIKTEPNTQGIARFMEKGIFPVGFPVLQDTPPVVKEALEQGIVSDAERLRELVLGAGVKTLRQDIIRQKLQFSKDPERSNHFSCKIL